MKLYSLFKFNHEIIKRFITKKSIIIDATCGNGHDTNYLANLIPNGHVYSFDIQSVAINNAKKLNKQLNNITYICDSHENILNHIDKNIDLVVYNLGYLPGGNLDITTNYTSTINSINICLEILKPGGCIIVTIYTEHDNYTESNGIEKYVKTLNKYQYNVLKYQFINFNHNPYSIFIEKK
ncbi:MAG: class I SAM-dependent methyltransferase [Mycoplasmatales bacterium]